MKSLPRLFAGAVIVLLAVVAFGGCSGPNSGKTITSIAVTPATPANLKVGSTQQFTATATFSDGSTLDISATATWTSGTPATATISTTGLATAVAVGTTQITAAQAGVTSSPAVTLTVIANKTIVSIAVTPATPAHLRVGATQQFTATATFSDTTTADISATATWTSGTPATATISNTGLATGVAAGTTLITAAQGGVTSTPAVTLTVISLTSIAVTPPSPSIALGLTQQFTATGTFSDASTADITTTVMWKSLTAAVATINTAGLATSVSTGTSQITATVGTVISPAATLTVTAAVAVSLQVTPANPTIAVGQTANFNAKELFTDGTTQFLPSGPITWVSQTPTAASILTNGQTGIATGLSAAAPGTSTIKATFGALTGTTLLTVAAPVPRFAYTISFENGVSSGYALNAVPGVLTPLSNSSFQTVLPTQLVFEPSGQFVYAPSEFENLIGIFNVDPVSGTLSGTGLSGNFTSFSGTTNVIQSVVDPTGRYFYALDAGNNLVNSYTIDTSNTATKGALTATVAAPTTATGTSSSGIVMDPLGRFVYVTDNGGTISGYSIGADGSLTALASIGPGPFTSLSTPQFPAIDSLGKFLFVPNFGGSVSSFSIAASGQLTFINNITTNINQPFQAVVDPAGTFLYVTNDGNGTVASIPITAGSLGSATTSNTGLGVGSHPEGLAIDPTGTSLVVVNNGDNSIALFGVATGVLTQKFVSEACLIPQFASIYFATSAPVIGPSNVFAANSGSNNISGFTANNATGVLATGAGSPTAGIAANTILAADSTGKLLFNSSPTSKKFGAFNVTPATAALSVFSAAPFALSTNTDALSGIVTEPTSQAVFVADTTGAQVEGFLIGNPPTSVGTTGSVTSVNTVVGDPQGTVLFALGTGRITTIFPNPFITPTNAPTASTDPPLSQTGTWTSGAIDPSGHFLVALDSAGKTLQSFSIAPLQVLFGTPDGDLTAVGAPLATAVTAPSSVTFDPLGRFVFVSDATNGTVTAFAFNGSTGAVTTTGKATTVSATGTGSTSIDASGTYLYAAVTGNGTTASGVAAFKINSDGSLTAVAGSPFATGAATSGTSAVVVTSSVK